MATSDQKERLHLAMSSKTKQLLDNLQERTDTGSMAETIRRAIALLDVVSVEQDKGGELYIHRANGEQVKLCII